jgi:DNA polymerase II small subunit
LERFLTSGINISPQALLYFEKLEISSNDLECFLQKISFSANFGSYVSLGILKKEFGKLKACVSKEIVNKGQINSKPSEIIDFDPDGKDTPVQVDLFKNKVDEELLLSNESLEQEPVNEEEFEKPDELDYNFEEEKKKELERQALEKQALEKQALEKQALEKQALEKQALEKPVSEPEKDHHLPNLPSENTPKLKNEIPLPSNAPSIDNKSFETDEENDPPFQNKEEDDEITKIIKEKRKMWETLQLNRSTSTFKAIASEYDSEFKVLTDPTGKIFSGGKIDEFLNTQVDKFNHLKKILTKRPEGSGLLDISMIKRLESSVEVTFVGMLIDKRITQNQHYILNFEDPTGTCTVIVRKQVKELHKVMEHLLPDHVVIVDGYLSINNEKKSRIVLANNIIFPDTPTTHRIQCPSEDLAICLISDTHFASKDWLETIWNRFVDFLNCRIGNEKQIKLAGKIKYLTIAGDLVDGIGVYPNQDKRLDITDIYKQYEFTADCLAKLPDHITVVISPGDHDSVRKAIPTPAIPKDIGTKLYDIGAKMVGCPSLVSLHGIKTQLFHGTSLIDMNMSIPGMKNEDPKGTMIELIRARHLAPTYGKKTELAPTEQDWLVIDPIPDILHTGHLHKNGCGWYNGILTVNSGCFQAQTDYMKSFGIDPDFGKPTIVEIKDKLTPFVIDLAADL